QFADANGQNSSTFSDSVHIDTKGPTGAFTIQGGADYSSSRTVTLALGFTDASDIEEMIISEQEDFSSASWVSYGASSTYEFASDGNKTLYVKTKDSWGQESDRTSATIVV